MIYNKRVEIKETNTFTESWRIFHKDNTGIEGLRNESFVAFNIDGVVKSITYARNIVIIAHSDFNLPRKVNDELKWLNEYVVFEVIIQDKSLEPIFKNKWKCTVSVNPNVSFNSVSVIGRTNENDYNTESTYLITEDGLAKIENTIGELIENKHSNDDLMSADLVLILEKNSTEYLDELVPFCQKHNIRYLYIHDVHDVSKQLIDSCTNKIDFGVAEIGESVVLFQQRNKIYAKYGIVNAEINKVNAYFYDLHIHSGVTQPMSGTNIPSEMYLLYDGEVKLTKFEDKTIQMLVQIALMEDFLNANFDSSITESHVKYTHARTVKYIFELLPPCLDDSYTFSSIYDPIKEITDSLTVTQPEFVYFAGELKLIKEHNFRIQNMLKSHDFRSYYETLDQYIGEYEKIADSIKETCRQKYLSFNAKRDSGRYSVFDDEIQGYQRTISEKEAQISKGIDVLNAKRRIDILQNKIAESTALKNKFIANESGRSSDASHTFDAFYDSILNESSEKPETESVEKVINVGEPDEKTKFQNYLSVNLKPFVTYVNNCIELLNRLHSVEIPENDPVYEKDGQNYICIENIEDYQRKADICRKFNLKCIVRR